MRRYILLIIVGVAALLIIFGTRSDSVHDTTPSNSQNTMETQKLTLTSSAFSNGEVIPQQFTCDGENIAPPLRISGVSDGVESLVLIMDDPDVPADVRPDQMFVHWVLYNIDPSTEDITTETVVGTHGANTAGGTTYTGPCPPKQYEPTEHRYFFKLYALDTMLELDEGATKEEVEQAMEGHVVDEAEIIGRYERP